MVPDVLAAVNANDVEGILVCVVVAESISFSEISIAAQDDSEISSIVADEDMAIFFGFSLQFPSLFLGDFGF